MKKYLLKVVLLFIVIISFNCSAYAQDDAIKVIIDGTQVQFDVEPQIIDGRTMLPVRAIFEKLGATIDWDEKDKAVNSKKDNTVITLIVGSKTMYVNGNEKTLDVPAMIIDGRTLVPVRAISEAFGNKVGWDGKLKTVSIIKDTANYKMLYATGDREKLFDNSEVAYQLTQGWYKEPLTAKIIAQVEEFMNSGKYLEAMQECEIINGYNVSDESRSKIKSLYNDAKNKYDAYVASTQKYSTLSERTEILNHIERGVKGETIAIEAYTDYIKASSSFYQSEFKRIHMEAIDISIVAFEKAYSISSKYYDLNAVSSKIKKIIDNLTYLRNNFKPMGGITSIFGENIELAKDILNIMSNY